MIDDPILEEVSFAAGLVRDPTDIPVALAAIKAKVDYLISEDKDLTANDETTANLHQHLKVLISGTFLYCGSNWLDLPGRAIAR